MTRFLRQVGIVLLVSVVAATAFAQRPPAKRQVDKRTLIAIAAAKATTLPRAVSGNHKKGLQAVVALLRAGKTQAAQARWDAVAKRYFTAKTKGDVAALVQWVLRESYLESNKDLRAYADKIRYLNDLKKSIRGCVNSSRAALRSRKSKVAVCQLQQRPYKLRAQAIAKRSTMQMPSRAARDHIKRMEERLQSVGDDAQLANIDLQNALQKQQQVLQTLSNVSKMLHDTAMAVIRKIG